MAGRYVDINFRVNAAQFDRAMKEIAGESEATAAKIESSFAKTNRAFMKTGAAAQSMGRFMTGAGIGLAAIGYVSGKAAISFQSAMERIHTQAGATQAQVDSLSKSVLNLGASGSVQYGPTQLAQALYHIQSVAAGSYPALRNTATAMKALKVAAQGAAVGNSDLEQTTSALVGAMFATRSSAKDLPHLMGLINATVGAGNMTMQQLVTALGRGVIPAFKQVGLTATDAFAALALFADSGMNASSAAAQVSTALHFLVKPSAEADKYLAALNMSSTQMAQDLQSPQGFLKALTDLKDHLDKLQGGAKGIEAGQVMASLFPGGRGRIILTAIQNLDKYGGKISAIYDQQNRLGQSVEAQSKTMSGKLHAAWAKIQTDLTRFGATLIPIISKYLPLLTHDITQVFQWFTRLSPATKEFLVKLTGFLLIGGPILLFFGKLISAYAKLGEAMLAIKAAGIAAAAGEKGAAAGLNILTASIRRFAPFAAIYFGLQAAKKIPGDISRGNVGAATIHGATVGGAGGILAGALAGSAGGPPGMLAGALAGAFAGGGAGAILSKFFPGLFGARGGMVTPHGIRHMAAGGPNSTDNVPAWLSAGEGIVNRVGMAGLGARGLAALNSGGAGGYGGDQPIIINANLFVDGRVLARTVIQQTLRKAARGPSSLVGGQLVTGG